MSEEPKPRNNRTFYWLGGFILFGLLGLAGIFFYWKYFAYRDNEQHANYSNQEKNDKLIAAVKDYQQWTEGLPDHRMNVDHELTRTGLRKIAGVLHLMDTLNSAGKSLARPDIKAIEMLADSVTINWRSGKHADMIKKAFEKTIHAVDVLAPNKKNDLTLAIDTLSLATKNINQQVLTLDQRDEVKGAFKKTAKIFAHTITEP